MRWRLKPLDELGYVRRGRSHHRPRDAAHLYGGSYPFVQTGDIKHAGLYLTEYSQTYSEAGLAQSRLWPSGTLCITIAANIADTAILRIDACFPDSVIGFIPDDKSTDARFVKYLFDALLQRQYKLFTQGAAQDNLSQAKLLSLKLPVPPLREQNRIASILSTYDDLIENNRRRIRLLEQVARLLYKEWFVHLRFPGHEHVAITNGVPEGWKKGKVSAHVDFVRGVEPGSKNYMHASGERLVPFLRVGDFGNRTSNIFIDVSLVKGNVLNPEDVAITMDGTPGLVGFGMTGAFSSGIRKVVPRDNCGIGWSFIYTLLKSESIQATVAKFAKGTTILHASSSIEHMVFLQPPRETLVAFESIVTPLLQQVLLLEKQNRKLIKSRDLLLPRLMSGKIEL